MGVFVFLVWIFALFPLCLTFIFDSPTNNEVDERFEKNECFNNSEDLGTWMITKSSGSNYKRWVRPGLDENAFYSPPLDVNVSIDMNSMASVDELNSEYKIILKIDLEWIDSRLKYNCSKIPLTFSLPSHILERLWSPTLGVSNIKDPETSVVQGEATLILGQFRTDGYIHIRLK